MITDYLQPLVLGLVQGLTEFLPVSSTGHLILVRELFGWEDQGLAFDVVMHLATLLAVVIYFWSDWKGMLASLLVKTPPKNLRTHQGSRQLVRQLIIATIPAIVAGLALFNWLEAHTRNIIFVSITMVSVGLLFVLVEKVSSPKRDLTKATWRDALAMGLAQAVAVLPGVSRSGATIAAGIYMGLKRDEAARLSFLVGGIAIFLAGCFSAYKLLTSGSSDFDWISLGVAFVAAFLSGWLAIKFMLMFLKNHGLIPFAIYRLIVGVALIIISYFNLLPIG